MDGMRKFIADIKSLVREGRLEDQNQEFWIETASKVLDYIDSIVASGKANASAAKDYNKDEPTILEILFETVAHVPNLNRPFTYNREDNSISYYELAYSRCCTYICQLLGDKFPYIQKLLIKYLFGQNYASSILASDVYVFIMRVVHPNQRTSMCQIVMNFCKLAPPDALVKGAALINRVKHPTLNFTNPRYQHILADL